MTKEHGNFLREVRSSVSVLGFITPWFRRHMHLMLWDSGPWIVVGHAGYILLFACTCTTSFAHVCTVPRTKHASIECYAIITIDLFRFA